MVTLYYYTGMDIQLIKENFYHYWHKIAIILLATHSLIDSVEAIMLMYESNKIDQQFKEHIVQAEEINHLVTSVIVISVATMINVFFAYRLSKVEETTAHNIDLFIATLLVISTQFFQHYLIQFDLLSLLLTSFVR